MFRLFVMPMIIGVLALLGTWLIAPLIFSDPGIVSIVARYVVNFSNSHFETMPPLLASYVAGLNLVTIALTLGLLMAMLIQLLLLIWAVIVRLGRLIVSILLKFRSKREPRDLPPIEMDPSIKPSKIGQGVMGRGLDSIDQA